MAMNSKLLTVLSAVIIAALLIGTTGPVWAQEASVPSSQPQIELSFAPLVKKTAPAVVNIYTKRIVEQAGFRHPFLDDPFFAPFFGGGLPGGRMRPHVENALGSGVIVDSGGLVVTNAHVVKAADEIKVVLLDGREFDAKIALIDKTSDLALLRLDAKGETLPFAPLRPSETLEVGDLVLAIGNPFGVGQTVTSGIVSALARSSLDISDFNFFIQTDAAINPGNSGGPLVAMDGGVVGINTAIYSRDGGSLGIGFAIPSEMVASVIAAEKSGSASKNGVVRPWLGVTAQGVTSDIAQSMGLKRPQGALVAAMHPASPLKSAGVQVGDVILSFNGRDVRDAAEMKFRMATVPIGEAAAIQVSRAGKILDFSIPAIAPPDVPPREALTLKGRHLLNGASLARLNPAVALELGLDVKDDETGVIVTGVDPRAPAARIVSPGDIILAINGQAIKSPADIEITLQKTSGQGFAVTLSNQGRVRQIVIR